MKIAGLILLILAGVLIAALLAAALRAAFTKQKRSDYTPTAEQNARAPEYARVLSEMVKINTVSAPDTPVPAGIPALHRLLEKEFPLIHKNLEKTEINGNLLFHWKGRTDGSPLVLMSHQDVVPADGDWEHGPFSGDIADGKVWGRGSGDTKCSVFAFFRAVEELLQVGFVPERDVWLSSSCTEEWGGPGCPSLVAELRRRGVKPGLVCDEGGGIIAEPIAGIHGKFAMIGVFEKGLGNVRFTARSAGGHASAPPKHTPLVRLADFVSETEKHPPFRKKMLPEVSAMFRRLSGYAPFAYRLLFGNLWLFKPLLLAAMPAVSPQAAAMLQTTAAFTVASGSEAYNVIPREASVVANLRFIPHQGMEESLAVLKKRAAKHDVDMEVIHANDFSRPADIHGSAFRTVEKVVAETFPGLASCPYVVTGGTDARFYQEICDNCVRFAPVVYGPEQMKGMHGLNENLEYSCLPGAVDFYKKLIQTPEW